MPHPSPWISPTLRESLTAQETDAFRAGGTGGAWVDWWAGEAVISAPSESIGRRWDKHFREWEKACSLTARRVYFRQLTPNPDGGCAPVLWREPSMRTGEPDKPASFWVRENGLRFLVNPGGGYSAGLFPDQRENRLFLQRVLREGASEPRVLNLFAFTCAFSVAAAAAGAFTLSVDLSGKFLGVGRENFQANGLTLEGHRWWEEDVQRAWPRLQRREEVFDAIVLDPPTFSRGHRGRVFRFGEAVGDLLGGVADLLRSGGWLLLSTNSREHTPATLRSLATTHLPRWRQEPGRVPEDFASSSCASTLWLQKP